MKVTQEKLPASQIGLEIEITPEMSQQAYEKTLQEFTRFANIPGFRKGKVPRQVLIQRYGSSRIKATVVEELIQTSLKEALDQEKIEAIGNFELRSSFDDLVQQFQPGAAITFSAAVDVPPEAKLDEYTGLQVKAEEIKYDPAKVDQVLEDARKRSATLVPVEDRPAQAGDIATVDFTGQLAAEAGEEPTEIPGGSAQDFEIELTEGRFIEGFVDGIIGMQSGETKEVAVTFPEDYPQKDLAGKDATFTITLKELKQRELPELDDDFAQEASQFETLTEWRESLESRFQKEAEQKTKENKQEALSNELSQHIEVELPETLIKQEVDYSITQTAMRLEQQGMDIKKTFTNEIVSMLREQARPEAIERLKRTIALGEVAKRESIAVEPEAVEAKLNEILADYSGQDIDVDRLRQVLQEDLLREKILDWLEAHGTVELVPEGSLSPTEAESQEDTEDAEVEDETAAVTEAELPAGEATVEVEAKPVDTSTTEDTDDSKVSEASATPQKGGKQPSARKSDEAKSDSK
jgi:trigger factor